MGLHEGEGADPRESDGLDPLTGNVLNVETSMRDGDHKPEVVKKPVKVVNKGFDPQPTKGSPLWTIDPKA